MTKSEHVELARIGSFALDAWRREHPDDILELSGADLKGANLGGSNLAGAWLEEADLSGANLFGADLSNAHLEKANLQAAVLSCANLTGGFLQQSNLKEVQFNDGEGGVADLTRANLEGAALTAQGEGDVWNSFLELSTTKGLETVLFDTEDFLANYLEQVFAYASDAESPEAKRYPDFFDAVVRSISALRELIPKLQEPSNELLRLTNVLTSELVSYVREQPELLQLLRPRQFEELVAELLSSFGWQVEMSAPVRDGGYDLFAISKDISGIPTSWIIECKKYPRERVVGVDVVRSLYGVKNEVGAANVLLATTSGFSEGVKRYKSSRYDIALCDYNLLLQWTKQYKPREDGLPYMTSSRRKSLRQDK
jgi:hypothetical protein